MKIADWLALDNKADTGGFRNRLPRRQARRPLHTMPRGPGFLWDPKEVGEARKRVAAKTFLRRNSTVPPVDIRDVSTPVLVTLCQTVQELILHQKTLNKQKDPHAETASLD